MYLDKKKANKKQQQLEVTLWVASYMSYDFLFVEQELGALQTILRNKQIKAHYMILLVEKQNYFNVLMAILEIGRLVAA